MPLDEQDDSTVSTDVESEDSDESQDSSNSDRMRRAGRVLREWIIVIVGAVVLAVVIRTYAFQTFYIPSASMETTLMTGDRILVNRLAYHFRDVHRGDIVVFARPPEENCAGPLVPDLVKRVIGLPGDHLTSKGDTVYVNGKPLAEPWLPPTGRPLITPIDPITVGKDRYFVMGDNRGNSCDSRMWGTVKRSYFVGNVQLILWPISQFGFPD